MPTPRSPFQALRRVPAWALLLVLAMHGGAWSSPETPASAVPEGIPVTLDGWVIPSEWSDSLDMPLAVEGTRLRMKQLRGMVLLAFETGAPWTHRSNLTFLFCRDAPKAGMLAPGCVRINYEPREHDRRHVIVSKIDANGVAVRIHEKVVARSQLGRRGGGVEVAFPASLLDLAEGAGMRFCAHWVRPGAAKHLTFPGGLDFVGRPPKAPPDLARATNWALLTDWGDVRGPGAFSRTEWQAFVEHDRKMADRSTAAFSAWRLLKEEWKKTKKRDKELVPEILGNFAWIAEHETLTPTDMMAQAGTLWFLNRHTEALAMLNVLAQHTDRGTARLAAFERARLYESMGRFESAAEEWRRLSKRVGGTWAGAYEQRAKNLQSKIDAWKAEQQARAEDDAADLPLVALHTPHGTVLIQLFSKDVPGAVKHFLGLVESGFYDGTLFHRVKGDHLAQGGDPKSRDQGCEFAGRGTSPNEVSVEVNQRHKLFRGAVGFALGMRRMNGSQFFIMTRPDPDLLDMRDEPFTCFGRVIAGMEAVDRLEYCDPLTKAVVLRK